MPRNDLAALQGSWAQVALEADGISNPPDEYSVPDALTTFTGTQFVVRRRGGELLLEGAFALNESVAPKTIDYIDSMGPDKGKRLPAIYKLEGDQFIFIAADDGASSADSDRSRPPFRDHVAHRSDLISPSIPI